MLQKRLHAMMLLVAFGLLVSLNACVPRQYIYVFDEKEFRITDEGVFMSKEVYKEVLGIDGEIESEAKRND